MKAVVLAGGRERGFASLARRCPKALLPLANVPLLAHTFAYLAREGVRDVTVCINDDAGSIRQTFPDGRRWGLALHFEPERIPLGTAGCLGRLRTRLHDDTFVVVAGLPFLDCPLGSLLAVHRERGATLTVALTDDELAGFPERVALGADGSVVEIETPYRATDGTPVRTLGLYLLEPRVFELIGSESYLDLKEQLVPRIQRAGHAVVATRPPGVAARLDTAAAYLKFSHRYLSDGYMGWQGDRPELFVRVGRGTSVSDSGSLRGPLIVGDGARIRAGGRVQGPTAIGPACELESGSLVAASVVMAGARVSALARLERCVVAPGCHVPPGTVLADRSLSGSAPHLTSAPLDGSDEDRAFRAPIPHRALKPTRDAVKRALDIVGAVTCLAVSAPALAFAALAIKLDSRGPVLFRQRRAGRGGEEFSLIKLRTMVTDAEDLQATLSSANEVDGPMFKVTEDPRVTRVGRFLRRTRLDEFPQLINVLKGKMSLVGPRPLAMREMRYNPAWRDARLRVKPGITGLWQVRSTRKNSFQDWITADIEYTEERTLWLDLKILGLTAVEFWRSLWSR